MMGRLVRLLMCLLVASAPLAHAQDLRPGEQVRLVERDQHIPAHPGPGDSRVSLRLVSGSQATVLRVHAATGWIEVRGEPPGHRPPGGQSRVGSDLGPLPGAYRAVDSVTRGSRVKGR
jgi:hypothetical protein